MNKLQPMKNSRKTKTQADAILNFYHQLQPGFIMAEGIEIMNPFENDISWNYTERFYRTFYSDDHPRIMVFGINPGRFGGGITGIPFTDPVRLENDCGIKNDFRKLSELSSIFVYEVVKAYGGAKQFYHDFFITALSPLGFTRNGINLNYYDDKELLKSSEPFIVQCIQKQIASIKTIDRCFCLGEGTNYKIFSKLNAKHGFFSEITPLPHPRWIMQYRRKKLEEYIELYVRKMKEVASV